MEIPRFLDELECSLANGVSLLQLRAKQLSDNEYQGVDSGGIAALPAGKCSRVA